MHRPVVTTASGLEFDGVMVCYGSMYVCVISAQCAWECEYPHSCAGRGRAPLHLGVPGTNHSLPGHTLPLEPITGDDHRVCSHSMDNLGLKLKFMEFSVGGDMYRSLIKTDQDWASFTVNHFNSLPTGLLRSFKGKEGIQKSTHLRVSVCIELKWRCSSMTRSNVNL